MGFFFNKNALKNKIQHYKMGLRETLERIRQGRRARSSPDLRADVASQDSFPASDPPGYISKTPEDRELR